MTTTTQEKINLRLKQLPKIWGDVAGILKKRVNPLSYQKKIRTEWNKRSKNLSFGK